MARHSVLDTLVSDGDLAKQVPPRRLFVTAAVGAPGLEPGLGAVRVPGLPQQRERRPGDLRQQKGILSQFWVQKSTVKVLSATPLKALGEGPSCCRQHPWLVAASLQSLPSSHRRLSSRGL